MTETKAMTDLEMTKLCAEAMGYKVHLTGELTAVSIPPDDTVRWPYAPLHDDAQAMALVKKFNLYIYPRGSEPKIYSGWQVSRDDGTSGFASDFNRAIVECVAKMKLAANSNTKASGG